jgi:hypothetical protein
VLGARVPRAVVIIVAEVPRLAWKNRPRAARADGSTGGDKRCPDFPQALVTLAITALRGRLRLRPDAHAKPLSHAGCLASAAASQGRDSCRGSFPPFAAKPWPLVGLSVAFHHLIGGMTQTGVFWDWRGVRRTPSKKPVGPGAVGCYGFGTEHLTRFLELLRPHDPFGSRQRIPRAGLQPAKGDVVIA